MAQATVLSREAFIREALRGTTLRERPPAEYGEIVRELRGIGSNVHQLLLKARTLDYVDEIMLQETVDCDPTHGSGVYRGFLSLTHFF